MDTFARQPEFFFVGSTNGDPITDISGSTMALSFEQVQYITAWSQQSMPTSPYYDPMPSMPSHQPVLFDYHESHQEVSNIAQAVIEESPSPFALTQSDHFPQQLASDTFLQFGQARSLPISAIIGDSHNDDQTQEPHLLTTSVFTQAASFEDEQGSWSASASPSLSNGERSNPTSPLREVAAMARKSSATQCELCDKWVVDMKKHKESHEETRTAKCPLATCAYTAKGMSRTNDIKRHVIAQHWAHGLSCTFCPGGRGESGLHFEKAQAFRTHMRNVHAVQNRGTRDALKMPEIFKADGGHAHCHVCQLEMKNYQHLHDHLESCIRRQLVIAQDVDSTNVRNLANVPSPQLSKHSQTTLCQSDNTHTSRRLKKDGTRHGAVPLHESVSAGNIGPVEDATQYPPGWQVPSHELTVMHRTITTYDGPTIIHRENMVYGI